MQFYGEYWFLNNSAQYPLDLEIEGRMYHFTSAEAAYMACKAPSRAEEMTTLTPKQAKEAGKKFKKREIRPDWEAVKLSEMKRVLAAKFQDPMLRQKLLQAGSPITMDNPYHDIYWGLYNGKGQNKLGKLLEEVREDIRQEMGIVIRKETSVVSYKIQQGGLVAFDTETTGLSSKYDDILQITIVGQDGAVLLNTYVKPQNCTHWEDSEAVHGISPEMVRHAPSAEKVAEVVKKIFDHADKIIGYNVGFDTKMVTARFGYDFEAKEQAARQARPEEWAQQVSQSRDTALSVRDAYKQAVEEMNYLTIERKRLRAALKSELSLSSVRELDTIRETPELLQNETYAEYKRILNFVEISEKALSEAQKSRFVKVMEKYEIDPYEASDEEILSHLEEIAPPLTLEDILPLYKYYTRMVMEEKDVPHRLVDAMQELCPEKAEKFLLEAHDAAADTIATMEIAKKLYEQLGKNCPIGKSTFEDKLFGVSEGIVCHQISCDGQIQQGFSRRMYEQFPKLRRDYFKTIRESKAEELFGKVKISEVDENLSVASIFSRRTQGNAEQTGICYTDEQTLVSRVAVICDRFPDKKIYLPVISEVEKKRNDDNPTGELYFSIVDGIGAGKGGGSWDRLEVAFRSLNRPNLYFLDTQTGEIEAVVREKIAAKEPDEMEIGEEEEAGFEY